MDRELDQFVCYYAILHYNFQNHSFSLSESFSQQIILSYVCINSLQAFGGAPYMRSASDIAYNVALFIAKKGSYVNYYMVPSLSIIAPPSFSTQLNFCLFFLLTHLTDLMQYHGGTNFDRLASAFIITAYYDEAPLDEYGMVFFIFSI